MPTAEPAALRFFAIDAPDAPSLADEAAAGLAAPQAWVSPKLFYDALGSALFQAITELDEYYPTRTEAALMADRLDEIAAAARARLPTSFALVDLGAGDSAKAERLFAALRPARYVPIDIAADVLQRAMQALHQRHAGLPIDVMAMDFSQLLTWPGGYEIGPSLVFYPGSSIGNFGPDAAVRLLGQARELSRGGALLIGADLVKPRPTLDAAYDDALGVTAAFNLNVLRRLNRLIGSDFDVADWQHVAGFDETHSRIQMHLQARRAVVVRWPGGQRAFAAGERIHTENSYKWTLTSFEALLHQAGWRDVQAWTDPRQWFGVFVARA